MILMNSVQFLILAMACFFIVRGDANTSIDFQGHQQDVKVEVKKKTVFSTKRLELTSAHVPEISEVSGRLIEDENTIDPSFYDLTLLNECVDFTFFIRNTKQPELKKKKRMASLIKSFKAALKRNNNGKDEDNLHLKYVINNMAPTEESFSKFEFTLVHHYCASALESCYDEFLKQEGFLCELVQKFPQFFMNNLQLFSRIEDFSFLTVELVEIIFSRRNNFLNPFALNDLVRSVSLEVILKCLEMWDFELNLDDARGLFEVWGGREDFLQEIKKDPRSWLLFQKLGFQTPFPMDLFVQISQQEDFEFEAYLNLILAFIYRSEVVIGSSLKLLEFIHADLHKNDYLENFYMKPEMIQELNSHKAHIWRSKGQMSMDIITLEMELKLTMIEAIKSVLERCNAHRHGKRFLVIGIVLDFLQIPIELLSRTAFLRSQNVDEVISSLESFEYPYFPGFCPFVYPNMLMKEDFWIFLWKQLEIFEVPIAYNVANLKKTKEPHMILDDLVVLSYYTRNGLHPHSSWSCQLALLAMKPNCQSDSEESKYVLDILIKLTENVSTEFSFGQIYYMRSNLAAEVVDEKMKFIENFDWFELNIFKLAPEILSRDQIASLMSSPEARPFLRLNPRNVKKFKSFEPFTSEDLLEFYPLGGLDNLEDSEAFWTINAEALIGYLKGIGNGVNNPEAFVWRMNPECWQNKELVDLVAEFIPFTSLMKYPEDAKKLRLPFLMCDIVGRLERNSIKSFSSVTPQQLILKWLLQMEWVYLQYFSIYSSNQQKSIAPSQTFSRFLDCEFAARSLLINWLQDQAASFDDRDVLLSLVQDMPLSHVKLSMGYSSAIQDALIRHEAGNVKSGIVNILDNLHKQFSTFTKSKRLSQLNLDSLARDVDSQVLILRGLFEKYFTQDASIIEKEIWLNRSRIINLLSTDRASLIQPIPSDLVSELFITRNSPHFDANLAFNFFDRFGYKHQIIRGIVNLVLIPEDKAKIDEYSKNYHAYLGVIRSKLLVHELRIAKLEAQKQQQQQQQQQKKKK